MTLHDNPIVFSLRKLDWAVFGCVTWSDTYCQRDSRKAEFFRRGDAIRYFQVVCACLGLRFRKLVLYSKEELGSSGQQAHLHFVIAKDNLDGVSVAKLVLALHVNWRHGIHDIRSFDSTRKIDGLRYVSKLEPDRPPVEYISPALMSLAQSSGQRLAAD
jgi:hypothetical protein